MTRPSTSDEPRVLTELQHSMLLHSLSAPEEGSYVVQCTLALSEPLDVEAFGAALRALVEAHPVLRTVLDPGGPSQFVRAHAEFTMRVVDWRDGDPDQRLRDHLLADKHLPFDFTAPPIRFLLARTGSEQHRFLLTVHHALVDGRSLAALVHELVVRYDAFRTGGTPDLQQRTPFSAHLDWLAQQDFSTSEPFWRTHLAGFTAAPRLGGSTGDSGYGSISRTLPEQATATVEQLARENRIPVSVFVHAAWAMLLAQYQGSDDVVFGATRSCRAGVPGSGSMLGLLINTLPHRTEVDPAHTVIDFVRELRDRHKPLQQYEHTPLGLIRQWADVPASMPLFESILVFEDFAVDTLFRRQGGRWENTRTTYRDQVGVPLTLNAYRDSELAFSLGHDRSRFDAAAAASLLTHFVELLSAMAADPTRLLGTLPGPSDPFAAARAADEFWVRRLTGLQALRLPHEKPSSAPADEYVSVQIAAPGGDVEARVLAFLSRISGQTDGFDVGLDHGILRVPPISETFRTSVRTELELARARPALRDDIWTRPELSGPTADLARDGLPVSVVSGLDTSPRPGTTLSIGIAENGTTLWRFSARHFAPEAVKGITQRFGQFTASDFTTASLLTTADRTQMTAEWASTRRDYPRAKCVHQLITEQARRTPDAPAVIFGDTTLTYGELDRRSADLAAFLVRRGVASGSLAGVYLRRSADLVVTLLGVLRAGAAYVPLDPTYPPARIRAMAEDAGLAVLLTESALLDDVDDFPTHVVDLDRADLRGLGEKFRERANAGDLAYVIYTSGSTGKPKGVRVGHRALTNFLCAMANQPGCTAGDHLLAVTTVCFDIAGLELYLPLISGGRVEVCAEETAADGFALLEQLGRSSPTMMQATPATWQMLRTAGWRGDANLRVLCGGEALPQDLADFLAGSCEQVWNLYGPTETTIWSTVDEVVAGKPVTIGRPIANTRLHVLDETGAPVPPGTPGELFIGGDGVAQGYLKRSELTASRFVQSPAGLPPGMLYRTGDLVRQRPDGRLIYLNRMDNQVKVHGHRIELGEIESRLRGHEAVSDAVAIVREDSPGDRRIVAYLVARQKRASDADLRGWTASELPGYMVPSAFVWLTAIPQTDNGKVDRKALPAPAAPVALFVVPRSETERAVAGVWQDVLGRGDVGLDSGFFDLGGNSLLLMQVVKRLRDEFGVPVTRVDMFSHPTVRAMAGHLTAKTPTRAKADTGRRTAGLADLRALRSVKTPGDGEPRK
ncbi:amino acid adenylation domain-containing protein [Lentzea sp. BCCO 10_0856]|uniref:Amino acid adenylation domain-containing protein n=1 Tax=Lentzea miocenica TaxID=3095431 RepID=A0ABU4TEX2_9PSEU|nr:amino acid adenylation domain-containing protein [Lentzea sp. BCCO 10_0856]MDX8036723.1 amino acid adenylation domain-containing protein [Lentzea sp. BCCO 10_0856]